MLARAVADVVAQQAVTGIDIVNDGEFGKSGWANYMLERHDRLRVAARHALSAVWLGRDRDRFAEFMEAEFPRGVTGTPGDACVGPIAYRGQERIAPRHRRSQGRGGAGATSRRSS